MTQDLTNDPRSCCHLMAVYLANATIPIVYVAKFREYGLRILDGGTSCVVLQFCPWCGHELPKSLREEWFAAIGALGLEPGDIGIPKQFLSDEWWREIL